MKTGVQEVWMPPLWPAAGSCQLAPGQRITHVANNPCNPGMILRAHHTNHPGTCHTVFTVESKEMGWEGKMKLFGVRRNS